jgi:chemotaxis protein CheD
MSQISHGHSVREYVLQMGDIKVSSGADVLTCFGLGSCIGLFLHDRIHKIGGGAHIMLPHYHARTALQTKALYAEHALAELLHRMSEAGADIEKLRAKLVGGAHVVDAKLMDMGLQNIQYIQSALRQHKIYIAATDLGGHMSRTARFNIATGMVGITSQTNTYTL